MTNYEVLYARSTGPDYLCGFSFYLIYIPSLDRYTQACVSCGQTVDEMTQDCISLLTDTDPRDFSMTLRQVPYAQIT